MNEKKSTEMLENELSETKNFSDYIEDNTDDLVKAASISDYLEKLLKEKNCRISDIINRTNLNRAYVYQIFEGRKTPSRNKLITIAIGMQLELKEIQKLLKHSGLRPLYARDIRDAAIMFSVQNKHSFDELNILLYEQGLCTLE